ncbi:unnamed protein product, partial [marine sediment metagenome]
AEGKLKPIPLRKIIDPSTQRTRVRYVNINADPYIVGRQYMIRLEEEDFNPPAITRMAKIAKMTAAEFRDRFEYLV